jgi:ubiquinol-cytochrome c reductase cytochrome b subunit
MSAGPPPSRPAAAKRPAPARTSLRAWLADRLGWDQLHHALAGGTVAGGASLWHTLGSVAAGLFVLEAVTGIALATAYAPAANTAWPSVFYIHEQMALGWFIRGLHSFGSSALIIVSGLHLLQVVLFGAYRRPRELNWMIGLAMLGLVLLFAISGYLLPWDQKGYWAKVVEATIAGSAPVIGDAVQQIIQGGSAFGNLTLTRAFAFHALLLPAALTGLLALHIYLFRRHGYTPRWGLTADAAAARAVPFWPHQAVRNAAVGGLVLAALAVWTVARHGAPLESPADPTSSYLARPEWYALPLFQLRMYFEGPLEIIATMLIPGIATALAFALPFLDHARSNRPADRRRVLGAVAAGVLAMGALAAIAVARDARDPAFAKARAEENVRTEHAFALARKGIPVSGDPFDNDPMRRARALWDERCAGCHSLTGAGGDKGPDFKDYNSRAWIRGFLVNPEGPLYMGPAKLEKGMRAVEGTPEELDALTEYIYAETGAADADPARVARGKAILSPKDCDTCHDFDGESENDGPNLKGRGTQKWIAAVITDAAHGLLFGERNKMPKFGSKLSPAEIAELASFVYALRAPK